VRELQNRIVGIVGRKGAGKSTALREIISCRLRVAIFDIMAEHPSPNTFYDLGDCLDYLGRNAGEAHFHCALRPRDHEEEALNILAETVFDIGGICFAVEEAAWFSTAHSQPRGLDLLARMGRHAAVDLIWTAQRIAEVARRLTSATDVFVLLAMTEPRDLSALADRCGPEIARRVQALGAHGRVVYDVLEAKIVGS
jgi:hypothetical protein